MKNIDEKMKAAKKIDVFEKLLGNDMIGSQKVKTFFDKEGV